MDVDTGDQLALPVAADTLRLADHGNVVEVRRGGHTITAFPKDDRGLRNLAVIALTESKVQARTVAELFGLSEAQVSRIRSDYRTHGSTGWPSGPAARRC